MTAAITLSLLKTKAAFKKCENIAPVRGNSQVLPSVQIISAQT